MADENKTPENEASVHDEMEELARIFREELGKAKEEAEKAETQAESELGIDALENTFEVEGYAVTTGERSNTETEEMCECCGERPRGTERDPNSPFCKECAAIMEKYPYDWKGILMLIAVIAAMLLSFVTFIQITPVFTNVYRGKSDYNDKKLYSSLAHYSEAESYIIDNEISLDFKNLRKNEILLFYEFGADEWVERNFGNPAILCAMTLIENTYEDNISQNKKISDIFNVITSTRANILMLSSYEEEIKNDSDYKKLVEKFESLIGKKIYISDVSNLDSNTVHDELSEGFTPSGNETVVTYDEGWIRFYQYVLAESQKKTEDMALYLKKADNSSTAYEAYSDLFFARFCFDTENYDQAETVIKRMGARNNESVIYHALLSKLYRQRDKNYSAAKEVCLTGLETAAASYKSYDLIAYAGSYLSIEKALNFIMIAEADNISSEEKEAAYESAYTSAQEAVSYQNDFYGSTGAYARDLLAILALATNNTEKYEELSASVAAAVEENGKEYDFSSYVYDYKDGKISLEEIVSSEYFDVI